MSPSRQWRLWCFIVLEDDPAVFFVDVPVGHNIAQLKEVRQGEDTRTG